MSRDTKDAPDATDLSQLTAPDEFKRAIMKDPYASIYRFDFDAFRGAPIDPSVLIPGGTVVPRSGFYLDIDGKVIDWLDEGNVFPYLSPVAGGRGRYLFLTDRRGATTSDLRFIALRAGYEGNVRELYIR